MNMTRLTLTLLLVFTFIFIYAQSSIGFKVGGHVAKWNANFRNFGNLEKHLNPNTTLDFQYGAFFEIRINDMISIQPEILYLKKAAILIHRGRGSSLEGVSYIFKSYEFPLLFKLKFGDVNNISFFLTAGPSFGYGSNGGESHYVFRSMFEGLRASRDFTFDEWDHLNRYSLSGVFGAGAGVPLGFGRLIVEARYIFVLTKFQIKGNHPDETINNSGIGLSIGYMVPLSSKKKFLKE